jgi:hypothetical protein
VYGIQKQTNSPTFKAAEISQFIVYVWREQVELHQCILPSCSGSANSIQAPQSAERENFGPPGSLLSSMQYIWY